ncbi:hypothetical protein [Cupriavidus plantarum]|uniref:hypothetical protein n=1 Tax=Cupriavidus plantarum TaxID=942865 RepID=UPI000E3A581F|nr:hypothetical protein [Cupriavidus plantarum]REE92567.1 hypothetical protein C7418_3835 [Cupriavidus plantarum]
MPPPRPGNPAPAGPLAATRLGDPARRRVLRVGFGFTAALACAAMIPALTGFGGDSGDTPPVPGMAVLQPADVSMFRALLPAIVTELGGLDAAQRDVRLDKAVRNIDATIAAMGQQSRGELRKLLDLLASRPLRWMLAGISTPWHATTPEQARGFLERWRASRFATLNAGGVVLVKLANVSYFVLPEAWAASGYPGPNPAIYRALHA